jgi:ribonuclease P/MRP protein subunit POP5
VIVPQLPKNLRPRWRYLGVAIEAWPDAALDRRSFQARLWERARGLYGDVGGADLDLTVVRFDGGDGAWRAIVRTHRGESERARSAVASVRSIDGDAVGLRVRGVSGTVRACEEKYIGRPPEASEHEDVAFGNARRRAVLRDQRVDVHVDGAFLGATTRDLD